MRVRIGAVTTDRPLVAAAPVSLGAARFCERCRKCAECCPSHALSTGARETVRGVPKWPTDVERCYAYWRLVGTDCGICMATCPFSHPDTWWHNAVRAVIRRAPWLARPSASPTTSSTAAAGPRDLSLTVTTKARNCLSKGTKRVTLHSFHTG